MTQLFHWLGYAYFVVVLLMILRAYLRKPEFDITRRSLSMELVVVAYNEESGLPKLLGSLLQQELDGCRLTLHLVDDGSTDGTVELMQQFSNRAPFDVKLHLNNRGAGKVARLKELLPQLSSDLILLSDADCRLPAGWLQKQLEWFQLHDGLLSGAVLPDEASASAGSFQLVDWLLISGFGALFSPPGRVQSVFGGNLSLSGTALRQLDYSRKIRSDSPEDLQLAQLALQRQIPVHFELDPRLLVRTNTLPWHRYLQQKLRWLKGLRHLQPLTGLCVVLFGLLQLLAPLSLLLPEHSFSLIWNVTLGNMFLLAFVSHRLSVKIPVLHILAYPLYWLLLVAGIVWGKLFLPDDWER